MTRTDSFVDALSRRSSPLSLRERARVRANGGKTHCPACVVLPSPHPRPLSQRERGDSSDGLPVRLRWARTAIGLWCGIALLLAAATLPARADDAAAIERRLADSARYLASDELEGRGPGTKGLDLAADYIARQFAQYGLKTDLFDGSAFQKFTTTTGTELGKENRLVLTGPQPEGGKPETIELAVGKDYTPLSLSGTAAFDLPLVFSGYGITGKSEGYDDYAGIDVAGKAVVVLRHQPQRNDPKSAFGGRKDSMHAALSRKVANAHEHKAAAVIFCTDEVETCNKKLQDDHDPVMAFFAGGQAHRELPVVHCRRAALDRVVKAATGTDLAKLEEQIDQGPTPQSRELTGWRVSGRVEVRRTEAEVKNVVAVLEAQGATAEETIVVGAHYDHLGYGGFGSLSGGQRAIHNGADDNASGTAALLEVARALAARPEKPRRRVVFAAFTGEEAGLLGSAYYVQHPPVPIEKTVAVLNLDMVGRLRDDRLMVIGSATGKPFAELLAKANEQEKLNLNLAPGGPGPSDQVVFYARGVPTLHFFTGTHGEYHRTSDKFETLNVAGMRRVARLAEEVVAALADAPSRPEFVAATPSGLFASDGKRPFFGSMPDFSGNGSGYALAGVVKDGPAERAGLQPGDVVVEFGESKIGSLADFDSALRKRKAGDRVRTLVRRGKDSLTVEVTLDAPR